MGATHGFPEPVRDAAGEPAYPAQQVERLRLIKRLLDLGHRPGKVVSCDVQQLRALGDEPLVRGLPDMTERDDLSAYLALCKAARWDEFRAALRQELLRIGLQRWFAS